MKQITLITLITCSAIIAQTSDKIGSVRAVKTELISMTKCKNEKWGEPDIFEYSWDLKKLTISRKNSSQNCSTKGFSITADILNDQINIHENAITQGVAGCSCNYDLKYTLSINDLGIYRFHVDDKRENLGPGLTSIVFLLDLRYCNKGTIILNRFNNDHN